MTTPTPTTLCAPVDHRTRTKSQDQVPQHPRGPGPDPCTASTLKCSNFETHVLGVLTMNAWVGDCSSVDLQFAFPNLDVSLPLAFGLRTVVGIWRRRDRKIHVRGPWLSVIRRFFDPLDIDDALSHTLCPFCVVGVDVGDASGLCRCLCCLFARRGPRHDQQCRDQRSHKTCATLTFRAENCTMCE